MACSILSILESLRSQEKSLQTKVLDNGDLNQAVSWLEQQQSRIDLKTYELLLNECGKSKAWLEGQRVHKHILSSDLRTNTFLANLLIQMYGNCGSLQDAREVFNKIEERNIFSWALMMSAYSKHRRDPDALALFRLMELEGLKPDAFILSTVIAVCGRTGAIQLGLSTHRRIVETPGLFLNTVLGNALVSMYGRFGRLESAQELFYLFHLRDPVSWNSLLAAYTQNGHPLRALRLLYSMDLEGVRPTPVTFVILLDACSSLEDLTAGEWIHLRFETSELSDDSLVAGSVVNMYGKCGRVEQAREVFDRMKTRGVVVWNTMLAAYSRNGKSRLALELFWRMDLEGAPASRVTFLILLDAGSSFGAEHARTLHSRVEASGLLDSDVILGNGLISMLSKCGNMKLAREVFKRMRRKDVITWNTMISAFVQSGQLEEARRLFREMDLEGMKPDNASFASVLEVCGLTEGQAIHQRVVCLGFRVDLIFAIALVAMYSRNKHAGEAQKVLDSASGVQSSVALWNAVMGAYFQCCQYKEAIQLHHRMDLEGLKPDSATFSHLLTCCSSSGEVSLGKSLHTRMLSAGFSETSNVVLSTALISLYSRSGELSRARHLFEQTAKKDVVCWTAMVVAYAQQGLGSEAILIFRQMQQEGMQPNEVTFINILFACSHSGLLKEGCYCFVSMCEDYSIGAVEDHYMCLVDLLGRVGKLAEAKDLIDGMPFAAGSVAWMTLVGACTTQGDVSRGEKACKSLLTSGSQRDAPFVMLKNLMLGTKVAR